jgi:hypothetical protein
MRDAAACIVRRDKAATPAVIWRRAHMSDTPHRITILAKTFSAAAMEFHRAKMAEKGYRMEGRIEPATFQMLGDEGGMEKMFDGAPMFSVTFVRRETD